MLSCQNEAQNKETATAGTGAEASLGSGDSTQTESAAAAAQDTAYQIIPGQRIGQVTLGDSPEKAFAALGPSDAGDAAMGKSISTWYSKENAAQKHQLNIYSVRERTGLPDETVRVHQVRITSPQFTLAENHLKTGSTLAQIRNHFPQVTPIAYYTPQGQQRAYVYDAAEQGIAFEITGPDSVCVGITIHVTGSGATERYLPVHEGLVQLNQK